MRVGLGKGEGDVDGSRLPPPHLHRCLSIPTPCPQRHLLDFSASGSKGIVRGHEGHPELSSHLSVSHMPAQGHTCAAPAGGPEQILC